MNHTTNKKMNLSLTKIFLVLATGLLIWTSVATAQEKLGDLVAEMGFDWLAGSWKATTDDGQEIEISYQWSLDRYLATVDFKMGEYAYHGMIFYDAVEQKIVEIAVDNRGGTGKGTWDVEGETAISQSDRRAADGQTMKVAILHSKVDDKTMKLKVFSIDDSGARAADPWATLEFKRQKPKARKEESQTNVSGEARSHPSVPPKVQAAIAILKDDSSNPRRRYAAIKTLKEFGPEASASVPLLVNQLKDWTAVYSDWDNVRIEPGEEPKTVRFSGVRFSRGSIAHNAAEALKTITGKDFGPDYDIWIRVLEQQKLTGKLQLPPTRWSELKRYKNKELGFTARDASLEERVSQQRAWKNYGVVVETVEPTGKVVKTGLTTGDIISVVNGTNTRTVALLEEVLDRWKGKYLSFAIYRGAKEITFELKPTK